ncbi:type II secretion system F family protein [Roseiconus lacunae]|uniref:type II secretion system F family protein n=1 Tax=Roseiconus lacunae TaxID=2605694 RepID=UPI003087406E|nr:type II secretion system F family protein [Stieleria sp. HD01]
MTTQMPRLDDESFAMLLDEVSAMAAAGRSVIGGLAELDDRSLGKLGRAAQLVRARLIQGAPMADAIASLSGSYQTPVRLAIETMSRTGSTEPVRETVRLIREANEDRRRFRLAAINPTINVILAALVAFFVLPLILITTAELEPIKSRLSPTGLEIGRLFARNFALSAVATLAAVGVLTGLLYWAFRRINHAQKEYQNDATFCRWLALQIDPPHTDANQHQQAAMTEPSGLAQAIETSATVIGEGYAQQWQPTAKAVAAGAVTEPSLAIPKDAPDLLRQCVVELATGQRSPTAIGIDLRRVAEFYAQKARRYRSWWVDFVLRAISIVLMLGVIFILIRSIWLPLSEVLEVMV